MSDQSTLGSRFRSPLARRLIFAIILASSAITLCLTAVQLYGDYRQELERIDIGLKQIEQVHLKSLSQSLWTTSANDLRLQLDGIVRVPNLEYASVRDGDKLWVEAGKRPPGNIIERQYPMTYAQGDKTLQIGTLTVVAGLDAIYRQIAAQAIGILLNNALKTFLVAAFALLVFHRLVNRHLLSIATYVRSLNVRERTPDLVLARGADRPSDELDELVGAINLAREKGRDAIIALHESEVRLRLATEAARAGIWERDLRADKVYWSAEYLRLLGDDAGAMVGRHADWESRLHPEDRAHAQGTLRRCVETGTDQYESEYRLRHKDGGYRWFLSRGEILRDEAGQPLRMHGVLLDITESKRAGVAHQKLEAQLRQSQKMEALGTLAGGVAHDFNNLLSAIISNVELAQHDVGPGHPAGESLADINEAATRARELVEQILTFSRQKTQERKVIELQEVMEQSVRLLRPTLPAGIELVTNIASNTPNILADRTQIHQVIMNLCTNAWHAMKGKTGRIDISLSGVEMDSDTGALNLPPGRYARLSVIDNGEGMDAETLTQIFDPFFTTKAPGEGTGLGLSMVDGIVRNHEGAISVYSTPGQGTTFHLYFPAVNEQAKASGTAPASLARGSGQCILYLDDEQLLVTIATRVLRRLGYEVRGFTLPAEALAAFRADPDGFDAVITDLNMPIRSGLQVAGEILRLRPNLPIALASGHVTAEVRAQVKALGIDEIIDKPITGNALASSVRRLLDKAAAAAP
jgi:PAS domain S-box-containing protein